MPIARTMTALLLACHPEPAAAVTIAAGLLAAVAGHDLTGLLVVTATIAASQLAVGWHNDWLDHTRDRISRRQDKPLARAAVPRAVVGWAALFAVAATLAVAPLRGGAAAAVAFAGLVAALAYNWPLKFGPLSVLPYAVAFASLPAFVVLALPHAPRPAWWLVLAGALLGSGAHFANVLPDLDDDARTGVRGLPHRLGPARSAVMAGALLLAASATLVFGPAGPPSVAAVVGLGAAGAVLATGWLRQHRRPHSRAAFRSVLLAALITVGQLLGSTGQLAAGPQRPAGSVRHACGCADQPAITL